MGKLIGTSGALLVLACGTPLVSNALAETQSSSPVVISGTAFGGHEDVEALKAQISSLETKLANTETGRQYLLSRLSDALAENKAKAADDSAREAQMMADQKAASTANEELQLALERAKKGRRFMSEQYKKNRQKLMQAKTEMAQADENAAELQIALDKAKKGRKFLSDQYLQNRTKMKEAQAQHARESAELMAENEHLKMELERVTKGRDFLGGWVNDLKAEAAEQENEMDELAAVSFAQIGSAIGERDAAIKAANDTGWADALSAKLTDSFGPQGGTAVSSLSNNSVAIKVGNTGLFNLGSTVLSDNGKALLNEIGQELSSHDGVNIKLVGHTDNIPTGSSSRYASNNELSLARASSALSYLATVGVPTERLAAAGVGDAYPLTSNDTEEGRLANRRVEIILTPAR